MGGYDYDSRVAVKGIHLLYTSKGGLILKPVPGYVA